MWIDMEQNLWKPVRIKNEIKNMTVQVSGIVK